MTEGLKSLILGIVQGLTEFLPVSSSGHLEFAKYFLNTDFENGQSLLVTVILHFATALSTIYVFRKEIAKIISGLFQSRINAEKKYSLHILISMFPAVCVGLFFSDFVEGLFTNQTLLVAFMLLFTGLLLLFADYVKDASRSISPRFAFLIGLAQAVAIIPGISRSGATIASSLLLGVERGKSAQFSFLMVIPLIFGKILKDMISGDLFHEDLIWTNVLIGFIAAFITGILACRWMISVVRNSRLKYFAYYCFIAGIFVIGTIILS